MQRRSAIILLAGLALAMAANRAPAQDPPDGPPPGGPGGPGGRGPGGPGGPGGQNLVFFASVQEDLALTDKQKDQIKKLDASTRQKRRAAMTTASQEGFDFQERMAAMSTLNREQELAIGRVLDKTQKARLAQIELQREGLVATSKKEVAAKLKVSSAQSKKIKTIVDEIQQAQFRAMPRPPGGPGGPGDGGPGGRGPGGPGGGQFGGEDQIAGDANAGNANANAQINPGGGPGGPGGGRNRGGPPNFDPAEFAKMREAMDKLKATANAKIAEVLTADQKTSFDKMLGKEFDLSTIQPGPGGPGGPGGPPPGGRPASKNQRKNAPAPEPDAGA